MSKLFLARHGETKLNNAQRFQGWTDIDLNATGVEQAEWLRDRLATEKIDAIYTSNLQRASVTAEIIAAGHQLDTMTCIELREANFGELEGLTFKELSQLYPELAESWSSWSFNLKFPGGESVDDLNTRVRKFLDRLATHPPEATILIVAHSAPLRLLVCHLLGIEVQHWRQLRFDLASLSILETYPEGAVLSLLNDVSHLR